MPNLAHNSLQKALYNTLFGDLALSALIAGIYDRAPDKAIFPYITLSSLSGRDWSSKTTRGMEFEAVIKVWSREGGKKQTSTIMERIFSLLHDGIYTVDNNTLVLSRLQGSTIELQSDGWTYSGTMQFQILLQNT